MWFIEYEQNGLLYVYSFIVNRKRESVALIRGRRGARRTAALAR